MVELRTLNGDLILCRQSKKEVESLQSAYNLQNESCIIELQQKTTINFNIDRACQMLFGLVFWGVPILVAYALINFN
jgi:hypothetical protein